MGLCQHPEESKVVIYIHHHLFFLRNHEQDLLEQMGFLLLFATHFLEFHPNVNSVLLSIILYSTLILKVPSL